MDQEKQKISEEQTALNKHQQDKDQAAEQLKGSDADADRNTGADDLPDPEDAAKEIEGSDADTDRTV